MRPIYAEVLALRYSFEYSDIEIAALLGVSGDTVRTRLHRERKQLQVFFDEEGDQ
jgi:DNA-directed RNA polymerase specialized sigma24 family protein